MAPHATVALALLLLSVLLIPLAGAATFDVVNNCSYTVWAAAVPGGGAQLDPGQSWNISVPANTTGGRIWARTGCSFDSSGNGHCETGDCGGVLACTGNGTAPNTLAEFSLNQLGALDFFDISLVAGFNMPMDFVPTSNGCTLGPHCDTNITAQCPASLQAPGGCEDPCTAFGTNQYCCSSGPCRPTNYSVFFKSLCPQAVSYPADYVGDIFTCPAGADYRVVFCP